MIRIFRHRKIIIIIAANVSFAFLIALISVWLFFKNSGHSYTPEVHINKQIFFSFLEVFLIVALFLVILSYLLIKISRPILENLLYNERDINKKQEEKGRNEKALFTLLKNLPSGLIVYDVKEETTYFNDYAITYLGFTSNEFKSKELHGPPLHLVKEDGSDLPIAEYPLNKVIATRKNYEKMIAGIVQPSGSIVWVTYNAFPVFGSLGKLKHVMVTFLDVESQRKTEIDLKEANAKLQEQSEELTQLLDSLKETNTKLSESEARYKLISDFSSSWETFRHPDGELLYCSPYVEQIIGYTRDEYLKGIPFSTFVHADDLNKFTNRFRKSLSGELVPSCIVRLLHKDRTIRWVDSEMRPVISNTGELLGTRFSIWDITRLKETEKALFESKELLNLVFLYSNDWEVYRDVNGKLIYCSLAVEQMLGYSIDEYMTGNITLKEIVYPDDYETVMGLFNRTLKGETIQSYILRYVHKNKRTIWVDVSARPVFSNSGEMLGVRYSAKDITRLKENEFELKELNATKDKFFSIISHDLRSPFTALLTISDRLLEEHKSLSDELREEYISIINKVSKSTFELLENLLTWASSQSGKLKLNQAKINLKQLSVELLELLDCTAQNKKISLNNAIANDIWVWVDCNVFNTVMRNLISNSIKYTKENGTITLNALVRDGFAEVSVSDTGIGFDECILSSLFKIDENRSTPGTNNEKGTGLGLVLCKDLVNKLGGKIWATSEIGKGSSFYFTVPLSN